MGTATECGPESVKHNSDVRWGRFVGGREPKRGAIRLIKPQHQHASLLPQPVTY